MTIIKPFRMPRARSKSNFAHFSASAIKVRPASIIRVVSTSRSNFDLGVITIDKAVADSAAAEKPLLFLPGQLADGIEPSDDPLIDVRNGAYAESFSRRNP